MSYVPVPSVDAPTDAVRALLGDLAGRKEFRFGEPPPASTQWAGFAPEPPAGSLFLPGMRLNGAQLFIRNFANPDTDFTRVLVKWQTGTGKSIAATSIAAEFIRQFRARAAVGEQGPTVFFISFTARETIQEDMLRFPELGIVSAAEAEELRRMRAAASAAGPASAEARNLSGYVGVLRRRMTDRTRGGYFQFYGYKEFANRLFTITRAGTERGFDVQALYSRAEGAFGERLAAAVRRGDVIVNEDLLAEMRGGLLIADEVHNVYNILEKNNYGIAIQYALDALGPEAPRVALMSATPVTGSAAEVVDLLNLLVPRDALPGGAPLRRHDFFTRAAAPPATAAADDDDEADDGGSAFIVSALREGALARISRLAAGRVSFLLDADVGSYPRRRFVGAEVAGVPYLRLTLCPMSPFHERTLAREQEEAGAAGVAAGLAPNAYTLYDMAFPNPATGAGASADADTGTGLYRSRETPAALLGAPEAWRMSAGVIVEKGAEAGVSPGTYVITGGFLAADRLATYSTKYARIVEATLAAIRAGPGKIMIYHHRVRMSGVLLLQEALRMNGFADETSMPTEATICAQCGIARSAHPGADGAHAYVPARFVVAHSDVDRAVMVRSIARFNAPTNLQGYQFRVILGSKIVREGLNFRGVRHQFVASLPTDYPTLVQVFGRVVRKDSHAELPTEARDVEIRVFVTTRADGRPSPELQRYIDKGREYLVIQEVERSLHEYAVDGFANYERIRAALHAGAGGELRASLDALPYSPVVGPGTTAGPLRTATFLAYGHGEREVATLSAICRGLFRVRPVWTYDDLWAAARSGAVRGANYDPATFDEGNFALALEGLRRPGGDPPTVVARAGRFFISTRARADGASALDVESYLRRPAAPQRVSIRVADYIRSGRAGQNWEVRLREFEADYLRPDAPSTPELALVEYGAAFHYTLLRRLITAAPSERVTTDDERVRELYRRFRIAVTVADTIAPAAARVFRGAGARARPADTLVGYITPEAVALFDPATLHWYSASHSDFAIGRRHRENDIVVGFVVSLDGSSAADAAFSSSSEARFKLRPPVHRLRPEAAGRAAAKARGADIRNLARGAVCETRPREELEAYARRLRDAVARTGAAPHATRGGAADGDAMASAMADGDAMTVATADGDAMTAVDGDAMTAVDGGAEALKAQLDYAARFDRTLGKRFPSAGELCDTLRLHLLALEENARAPATGMNDGLRWLYLFNDRPPTVSALTQGHD